MPKEMTAPAVQGMTSLGSDGKSLCSRETLPYLSGLLVASAALRYGPGQMQSGHSRYHLGPCVDAQDIDGGLPLPAGFVTPLSQPALASSRRPMFTGSSVSCSD